MKREVSLDEISDGRLYTANDMVKADCGGCQGCSACCQGMGRSIILDPLDIHQLTVGLHTDFDALLHGQIELNVVDGLILPNLKMTGDQERCTFLSEQGRCLVHAFRPGICRLFPLGRYYEGQGFRYFLQVHECKKESRLKVKVKKWLDVPQLGRYERFVREWHFFLKDLEQLVAQSKEEQKRKEVSMYVLKYFYLLPFDAQGDFYVQFADRLQAGQVFLAGIK